MKYLTAALLLFIIMTGSCEEKEPTETVLHPDFSLTLSVLSDLIEDQPVPVKNAILARPEYFLELISEALKLPDYTLVLVDKKHGLLPGDKPEHLVFIFDYGLKVSRRDLQVRASVVPDLLAMNEAARQAGLELVHSSAYRSYEYQAEVYQRNVETLGKEQADRESAQPGKSQHQLGSVIDFGSITDAFADTPEGMWLAEHAWEFGFSLSYPDGYEDVTGYRYEPWHYRYISRVGTRLERDFFNGIQQYLLEFMVLYRTSNY